MRSRRPRSEEKPHVKNRKVSFDRQVVIRKPTTPMASAVRVSHIRCLLNLRRPIETLACMIFAPISPIDKRKRQATTAHLTTSRLNASWGQVCHLQ